MAMAEELPQFYRRVLPAPSVDFVSDEGRAIFREAMAGEFMNTYFGLAAQFRTQNEPAFCGLASLVMALNALSVDPRRQWKGVWRWFSEEMLACCAPLDRVRKEGVTIDTLACLARCNGAHAHVTRVARGGTGEAGSEDEAAFRAVVRSCTSVTNRVLLASYDRRGLGQTGSGHFSPIGGYCAARDMVLVLDVARFKLPPHWVPLPVLVEAMRPLDAATGLPRGWMVVSRMASAPLLLFEAKIGGGTAGSLARLHRCTASAEAADSRIQRAFSQEASCSKEGVDGDSKEDGEAADGASALLRQVAQRGGSVARRTIRLLDQQEGAALPTEPSAQAAAAAVAFVRVYAGLNGAGAATAAAASALSLSSRIDRLGPEHVKEAQTLIEALEATRSYALVREAVASIAGGEPAAASATEAGLDTGCCTLATALEAEPAAAMDGGAVERAVSVSVTHTISMLVLVVATQAVAASERPVAAPSAGACSAGESAWMRLVQVASDDLRSGMTGAGTRLLADEVVLLARQYQQLACGSCGGSECGGGC